MLRDAILRGELRPGEKIKIDEIRDRCGVGASPVREALSLLTSDGLVERRDQRGFRAAQVSVEDFQDLLRSRSWIEERALREAIEHGDDAWEEGVVLSQFRLSKTPRATSGSGFVRSDDDWERAHHGFHQALIAACGSPTVLAFCDQLYDRNIRYRNWAGRSAYPSRRVEVEHDAIAEAALKRDADRATRLLTEHYELTGRYVIERIAEAS